MPFVQSTHRSLLARKPSAASASIITANLIFDLNADLSTDVVTQGASVGSWTDQIGAVAFTQATGGQKPILEVALYNGHNALRFTASSSQFLSAAAAISGLNSNTNSIYIVCKGLVNSDGLTGIIFSNFSANGGTNNQGFFICKLNSNVFESDTGVGNSSVQQITIGSSTVASGLHVLGLTVKGGGSDQEQVYYDGTNSAGSSQTYARQTTAPLAPVVGAGPGGSSNYANVDVARILGYSIVHDTTTAGLNSAALKSIYGIP